jgi:hypothetical protein
LEAAHRACIEYSVLCAGAFFSCTYNNEYALLSILSWLDVNTKVSIDFGCFMAEVQKLQAPGFCDSGILHGGVWWAPRMEHASCPLCHPLGSYNFEVAPRFVENMCTHA